MDLEWNLEATNSDEKSSNSVKSNVSKCMKQESKHIFKQQLDKLDTKLQEVSSDRIKNHGFSQFLKNDFQSDQAYLESFYEIASSPQIMKRRNDIPINFPKKSNSVTNFFDCDLPKNGIKRKLSDSEAGDLSNEEDSDSL